MAAKSKLRNNKSFRRRYLTWSRMIRYGANNFTRNAWLTTAATVVMTITLLIIFTSLVARNVLTDTVAELRGRLDVPVYLKGDSSQKVISDLRTKLRDNSNVSAVFYESSDQARKKLVNEIAQGGNSEDLQSLSEIDASTAFPVVLRVKVKDFEQVQSLEKLVTNDKEFQEHLNPAIKTSFQGDKVKAINTIGGWARTAERVGIVATTIFVAISMLIIFNTIRMAIFTRRDEIEMMKLIGADKGFIRGPFIVEAVMYGFVAALIATTLGYVGLSAFESKVMAAGISISGVRNVLMMFIPLVLLAMITVGALIGIVSSRLAVRKYLKV